jgi:hypothetical protein
MVGEPKWREIHWGHLLGIVSGLFQAGFMSIHTRLKRKASAPPTSDERNLKTPDKNSFVVSRPVALNSEEASKYETLENDAQDVFSSHESTIREKTPPQTRRLQL